eukprot:CAMPEP_0174282934 /NCGR_PEP_ID=MMETSP0809-20121228/3519_1 /TAXON_ID=73025 ORGANISM="Eutreptiella gymnastica-like, Strain CCMP1594" /NCGR_SAMPLE_ID=MMETSP0809 /ASSEMBLY_ACC=CAM_ASM_000658 /LENGTH=101 /DNA_ID=CAMNT_0015377475 /DNA_START=597 /DNA_END=902 /DNA_ORIENTATION=-
MSPLEGAARKPWGTGLEIVAESEVDIVVSMRGEEMSDCFQGNFSREGDMALVDEAFNWEHHLDILSERLFPDKSAWPLILPTRGLCGTAVYCWAEVLCTAT